MTDSELKNLQERLNIILDTRLGTQSESESGAESSSSVAEEKNKVTKQKLLEKYRENVETHGDKTFESKRTKEDAEVDELDSWVKLRRDYADKLFLLLAAEIGFVAVLILMIGFDAISLEEWQLDLFFTGVLVHTFLLVRIIVKNLFDKDK